MSSLPRISLVTPSFQMARVLETTIRSVLSQDYPGLEYIVMDGGSTDGSAEIIERYASELAHAQSEPDGGQTHAIHAGLARATGDVLGWLNADDLLLPGALHAVGRWFADNPGAPFVVSHALKLDVLGRPLRRWYATPPTRRSLLYGGSNPGFAQPAAFWTKARYVEVGGIDPSFTSVMDLEWYLRAVGDEPAGLLPVFTAAFREHVDQKSAVLVETTRREIARLQAAHGYDACPRLWRRFLRKKFGRRRRRFARQGARAARGADPEGALAAFLASVEDRAG